MIILPFNLKLDSNLHHTRFVSEYLFRWSRYFFKLEYRWKRNVYKNFQITESDINCVIAANLNSLQRTYGRKVCS